MENKEMMNTDHEFSSKYEERKKRILMGLRDVDEADRRENRFSSMRRYTKVAVLLICGVILLPVSIHAAVSVYRFTVTQNGHTASGTIELEDTTIAASMEEMNTTEAASGEYTEMTDSNGVDHAIEAGRRYVEITFDYLPDGVKQFESGKYDDPRTDDRGISVCASKWNGDLYDIEHKDVADTERRQAGEYEYLVFKKGGVIASFDRIVYIPIKDKALVVEAYFGRDITDEELSKVIAGMKVKDAEGDNPLYWIGVDNNNYDEKDEVDVESTDKYIGIDQNESFTESDCVMRVDGVRIYDNTCGIDTGDMEIRYIDKLDEKFVDENGKFKDVKCRKLYVGDDETFSYWGDVEESSLRMVAVDITYASEDVEYKQQYMPYIDISAVCGTKNDNGEFEYIDDLNYYYQEDSSAQESVPMTFNSPVYVTQDGAPYNNADGQIKLTADKNEHKLTIYFLAEESEVKNLYMSFFDGTLVDDYEDGYGECIYRMIYIGDGAAQ